jgi:hypothetical protein
MEKALGALDEVQLAGRREIALRSLDRESHILRRIRAAIDRIGDGSCGICLHGEEEICALGGRGRRPSGVFCPKSQFDIGVPTGRTPVTGRTGNKKLLPFVDSALPRSTCK